MGSGTLNVDSIICNIEWRADGLIQTRRFKDEIDNIKNFNNNSNDEWILKDGCNRLFSFYTAWDHVRLKFEKVNCHKFVWSKIHYPKMHAYLYRAITKKLPTKDRLANQGMVLDCLCLLCRT